MYHNNLDRLCLIPYNLYNTQAFMLLNILSHPGLKMYVSELDVVYNVRNQRFIVIQQHHLANLKHLMSDLPIYTLTFLVLFQHLKDNFISYLVLTDLPEAIAIPDITADADVHTFISGLISRLGAPSTVTTDPGCQCESALWQRLMKLLGCKRIITTSYQTTNRQTCMIKDLLMFLYDMMLFISHYNNHMYV